MPVGVSIGVREAIAVVEGAGDSDRSGCASSITDGGLTSAADGVGCDSLRVVSDSTFESPKFVVAFRFWP